MQLDALVTRSLFLMMHELIGTELNKQKLFRSSTPQEVIRDKLFDKFLEQSKNTTDGKDEANVVKNSPFTVYFRQKVYDYKAFYTPSHSTNFLTNEFYCPKLFKLIVKQLHLLPIWSGIMISNQTFGYDVKTRLSNNPVENYFGQLKNNILQKKKNVKKLSDFWPHYATVVCFHF